MEKKAKQIFRTGITVASVGIISLIVGFPTMLGWQSTVQVIFNLVLLYSGMFLVRLSKTL